MCLVFLVRVPDFSEQGGAPCGIIEELVANVAGGQGGEECLAFAADGH